MFQFDVKVNYRLISGKFSGIKNALYVSVKVFSTKVLIGDTTFTSPTGDGTAILRGHPSYPSAKGLCSFPSYFKTPSIVPAPGIEPDIFRSEVKRSTD